MTAAASRINQVQMVVDTGVTLTAGTFFAVYGLGSPG